MNNIGDIVPIMLKVIVASFAAVGVVEYLKNFIRPANTYVWSIIMPFMAVGCYCACQMLPVAVIGSILTVGAVQLDYQLFVQGFKKIIESFTDKISSGN